MNSLPLLSEGRRLFDEAGLVDLEPGLRHPAYQASVKAYGEWLEAGRHGTMEYLRRGLERRQDPRNVFPSAQSLLVVARRYSAQPWGDGQSGPKLARYARGPDYHRTLKQDLTALCAAEVERTPGLEFKVCVDTSAVLERTWGALAGLGWIGKNGMLIHPRFGSYFLIGLALLSKAYGFEPNLLGDRCGACEKCLNGCPTQALGPRGVLDSRKCLSYQTLEHRGPAPLWTPTEWVAGCDVCQEVCPFNTKAARDAPSVEATSWSDFQDPVELETRFRGQALSRVKAEGWARNLERLKRPQEMKSE